MSVADIQRELAFEAGVELERQRVVKFLRAQMREWGSLNADCALEDCAEAIESGDHLAQAGVQGEVARESLVEAVAREMCKRQGYFDPDSVREEWSDGRKVLAWQQFADDARESIEILASLSHPAEAVREAIIAALIAEKDSPQLKDSPNVRMGLQIAIQIASSTITASSTTEVSTSSPSRGMVHE